MEEEKEYEEFLEDVTNKLTEIKIIKKEGIR